MLATIESRTETRTLCLTGSVQDVPAMPVQYSTVPGKKFQPETWNVTFVKHGDFPWKVERWQIKGRAIVKGNQLGKTHGRVNGYAPMDSVDRDRAPWFWQIISDNAPKD